MRPVGWGECKLHTWLHTGLGGGGALREGAGRRPRWEANGLLRSFRRRSDTVSALTKLMARQVFLYENKKLHQAQEQGVRFRFGSLACLINGQQRVAVCHPRAPRLPTSPHSSSPDCEILRAAFSYSRAFVPQNVLTSGMWTWTMSNL